ncbi:ATP11 protein-domain-containing protein [Fomitopsis serialis]|uniref:ATP11 protein-domain-containing protein n=1 Tax=Fomitopsis serialis TaxID=139415 RepID=UPI0020079447|nr:ATP11 protein-domain-containing protein [Neoantrodia serialis]KAH9921412.1 ATP11 protein-domain-containing protein [Neoantrodia serialis]
MLSSCRAALASSALRRPLPRCNVSGTSLLVRQLNSEATRGVDYGTKYSEKLQKRAEEHGKSVEELLNERKEQEKERRKQSLALEAQRQQPKLAGAAGTSTSVSSSSAAPSPGRRDSSPIKPLDSIIKLDKLLKGPVNAQHISDLWNVYHSSRSGGTGRGFVSACIPVAKYNRMIDVASKYSSFVVPIRRPKPETEVPASDKSAYEFYFMEWGFHGVPPEPLANPNPFAPPKPSSNSQTSTVLFTPLQEYKLRQTFATPYLVLTHYTDLAHSHGIVLMRGEITPSSSGASVGNGADDGRYMLGQEDAHMLGLSVQKFYLWPGGGDARTKLLQAFHETPAEFKWEELLDHVDFPL